MGEIGMKQFSHLFVVAVVLAGASVVGMGDTVTIGDRSYRRWESRLSDGTAPTEERPDVCIGPDGNLAVTWDSDRSVWARGLASDGSPLTGDVYVCGGSEATYPSVASRHDGGSIVVCQADRSGLSRCGMYVRAIEPTGVPVGEPSLVNSYTDTGQGYPRIATSSTGQAVVVWHGGSGPSQRSDVHARRSGCLRQDRPPAPEPRHRSRPVEILRT